MYKLSDGSGFFTATIGGPRNPGFVNWLKYNENNVARKWLLLYRNYRLAREGTKNKLGDYNGPQWSHLKSLMWALDVTPIFTRHVSDTADATHGE